MKLEDQKSLEAQEVQEVAVKEAAEMAAEFISDINPKQDVFEVKKIFEVLPRKRQSLKM